MRAVLCHGVFDLFHRGHVVHFREARAFGDYLIVSVVADKFVHKPKRISVYGQDERLALVGAVRYVDEVILCEAPGPEQIIENLLPDFYVRGPDYQGKEMPEEAVCRRLGVLIRYTPSSFPRATEIIEKIRVASA